MKKVLLLLSLWLYACSLLGQDPGRPAQISKMNSYLQKSKQQKTAATLLVGTGGLMLSIGVAMGAKDVYDILNWEGVSNDRETVEGVLIIGGMVMIGACVPLYIAAARNNKRAMKVSIAPVRVPALATGKPGGACIPAVNLKIRI